MFWRCNNERPIFPIPFYSYYIQHFDDSLRQGCIDLVQGNAPVASDELLRAAADRRPLATVWEVCRTLVEPLVPAAFRALPAPAGFRGNTNTSLSVFGGEQWLTQNALQFTRCADRHTRVRLVCGLLAVEDAVSGNSVFIPSYNCFKLFDRNYEPKSLFKICSYKA